MKKRNKAYIYTFLTFVLMCAAAVFVLNTDRRFKVKELPFTATEIEYDFTAPDNFSVENTLNYLVSNGLNTAIIPVNSGHSSTVDIPGFTNVNAGSEIYAKKDFIRQFKTVLAENKIQLYLQIDCRQLGEEDIITVVESVCDDNAVTAFVLLNYSGSEAFLQSVKETAGRRCDIFIHCDNSQLSQYGQSQYADGFICTEMNYDQYRLFKSNSEKTVLLHHNTRSLNSDIFVAVNFGSFDGAVVSRYNGSYEKLEELDYVLAENKKLPLFNLSVSSDFRVTYPTKDISTYYSGLFITGTGADDTVNVNGKEYPAASDGTFGVYFELAEGDNPITVSSGEDSKSFVVTRKVYKSTGNTVVKEKPWDDSVRLNPGRIIQTVSPLTSILSDPEDDDTVIAGLDRGTKLIVAESVEAERGGKKTYVYQLTNGGYIPFDKVEILNEVTADYKPSKKEDTSAYSEYAPSVLTAVTSQKFENGDRQIEFTVNNMPGITHTFTDEKLTLVFMDCSAEDIPIPKTDFFTDFTVTQTENSLQIDFIINQDKKLWGYDVKSSDGLVILYLQDTPHLSDSDRPLENITVMLDAGHGGTDSGTLGVASTNGPVEKDMNLAVAQATKALLESKGATVIMTREDDSFPSLDDRRDMARDLKPDLFIAIHHNSMDYSYNSSKVRGSECYYFTHQSKQLAQLLVENVALSTGRLNRGAHNARYYVTRTDICPSVLMEYGFMINPAEFSTLYHNTDIYKAAYGTMQAVLKAIPQ